MANKKVQLQPSLGDEDLNTANSTSGFTRDIKSEMSAADPLPVENTFGNISECYVSASGHTRLLTATKYGKRYMLKCLKPDFLYIPVYQQCLAKEFEIGLQMEHPHICRTLSMEHIAGLGDTIVMEYVDGDTLQTLIDEHRLTVGVAERIASQMMDAIEYMHSKQIIHRDLKPSNIMLAHNGMNVKIIDFSLADSDAFGVLKQPAGTYRYIAPEQLLPGAVAEPATDIYSLGMVLEDVAAATGCARLLRMGRLCAAKDVAQRPKSIEALRKSLDKERGERRLALWLAVLVGTLLLALVVSVAVRHRVSGGGKGSMPAAADGLPQDSNQVLDFHLLDHGVSRDVYK